MKEIIRGNSIAFLLHLILVSMAVGVIFLVRLCAEDLNADWLVDILFIIFYLGFIWLYVQAGAMLPLMRQRKKEWMSGILIVIVGVLIWLIAVMQNGLGTIHLETQTGWMIEFFYCIGAWPLIQYFPYPVLWLAAPIIPALLMIIGMYRNHRKMDEQLLKHL